MSKVNSVVTVYTKTVKRRKTGIVETIGCAYRTKTETPMHAHLRMAFKDAQTWLNPTQVITDFVPGINLRTLPIVIGGTRIGMLAWQK